MTNNNTFTLFKNQPTYRSEIAWTILQFTEFNELQSSYIVVVNPVLLPTSIPYINFT